MNRTARALVSLYALLCLVAGMCVPALHAAHAGAERTAAEALRQSADASPQDRRDDTPAPEPHDHQECVVCHAGHGPEALPEQPSLIFQLRVVAVADAPRASPARAPQPSVSLPPSRAPPRA